jgi:hypothetical protein
MAASCQGKQGPRHQPHQQEQAPLALWCARKGMKHQQNGQYVGPSSFQPHQANTELSRKTRTTDEVERPVLDAYLLCDGLVLAQHSWR